jgi:hypothetical protein
MPDIIIFINIIILNIWKVNFVILYRTLYVSNQSKQNQCQSGVNQRQKTLLLK